MERDRGAWLEEYNPAAHGLRYSKRLYQFAKRLLRFEAPVKMFRLVNGRLFFGCEWDQGLVGGAPGAIVSLGSRPREVYIPTRTYETLDFWLEYKRVGRCYFDPEHTWNYDGRMLEQGDHRTCNWCGQAQILVTRYVPVEEWRNWCANV